MGKKNKEKYSQKDIKQYIYDDYIFNRELESTSDIIKHMSLLVDNNMASKVSSKEDMGYIQVSLYKIASMFMTKYNKSLKDFKRRQLEHEYSNEKITADISPELVELSKEGLEPGIYYAKLGNEKHDDYAMLHVVEDPEDSYMISFELFFIGYKHRKYKKKFFGLVDHYKKINEKRKNECLVTLGYNFDYKETQFKSFDRMVFTDKKKILQYIDNWVESIPIYHKYEMIPKLSILLYGEPGTGKSTFCKALAKYLGIEYVGQITAEFFVKDDRTTNVRKSKIYSGSEIVYSLDDIDCICKSREEDNSNENGKILSALLEFLDNPNTFYYKAKDGKYYPVSIVVATTNYYDKLDTAIKRYGRFDLKIEMKPFNYDQAQEMCALYDLKLEDIYHEKIDKSFSISPAYLQALCMENVDKTLKEN